MDAPDVRCRVSIRCQLNPSEDPAKVRQALANLFPDVEFAGGGADMGAELDGPECLGHLCGQVRNRRMQAALARQIRANGDEGSFWFYLNKQAAFAGTAALCENEDESPLGPVRVSVRSPQARELADWLCHA